MDGCIYSAGGTGGGQEIGESNSAGVTHTTSRQGKLMADTNEGRKDEAFPCLRSILLCPG